MMMFFLTHYKLHVAFNADLQFGLVFGPKTASSLVSIFHFSPELWTLVQIEFFAQFWIWNAKKAFNPLFYLHYFSLKC